MNVYQNKVAVITGAASGIGSELARQLAGHGARLALSDINPVLLSETAALCGDAEVRTYRLDVASQNDVAAHAQARHWSRAFRPHKPICWWSRRCSTRSTRT